MLVGYYLANVSETHFGSELIGVDGIVLEICSFEMKTSVGKRIHNKLTSCYYVSLKKRPRFQETITSFISD